jgi:predicted transcriptional regulator/transcriptional regulator with XRE-family HTH domain
LAVAKKSMLGTTVRRLRRQRGVSQKTLAAQLEISPSYLNLIEHEQRPVTPSLLVALGRVLDVDLQAFLGNDEARLLGDLTETLGDPLFGLVETTRSELSEFVGTSPALARALVELYRAYRSARNDVQMLMERLADNPFLSASTYRLLTLLTSIRSFAEILHDNADLAATERQHFHGILASESEKLTGLVRDMLGFFANEGLQGLLDGTSPSEQVTDFLHAYGNYFADIESAAAELRRAAQLASGDTFQRLGSFLSGRHGVRVELTASDTAGGELWAFDADRRRLSLSEALPRASINFQMARLIGALSCGSVFDGYLADQRLTTPASRELCREALAKYFAGALLMPYKEFRAAARSRRHDLELLQHRFGASFEQVCHRLTTLRRPGAEGIPFHFLRVDPAGNISKRFGGAGFHIPRFGGACPLWNVHAAFMTPGIVNTQLARLPDGGTFLNIARAVTKPGSGHRMPRSLFSVCIGCAVAHADQVVYADGIDLTSPDAAVPVGVNCRLCPRMQCRQRAYPPLIQDSAEAHEAAAGRHNGRAAPAPSRASHRFG